MKNLLKIYLIILTLAIAGVGTYAVLEKPYQEVNNITNVGAPAIKTAGLGVYRLAGSGISSSASSMTLTSLTISQNDYAIQDSDLSDTFYITLEPGDTDRQEFISCSTVGTNTGGNVSISGCTRGISPISPYTASSTLRFSHSGGSKVIFSNSPSLYDQALFKGNDETITGTYTFSSTGIPIFDTDPTITDDKHFATKKYADDLAIAGSPDATLTVKGLVEIATQIGMASTSVAGSGDTTAWLGLSAAYSTSTPSGDSYSALFLPVSQNNGLLHQNWWDYSLPYTWTGAHIFSSTVDISGDLTVSGETDFATTTISDLTATNLTVSGTLTGVASTTDIQIFTIDGTWTKLTGAEQVCVQAWGGGGGGGDATAGGSNSAGGGGGGGAYKEYCFDADDLGATEAVVAGTGGAAGVVGESSSFDNVTAYGGGAGIDAADGEASGGGGGGGSTQVGNNSETGATGAGGAGGGLVGSAAETANGGFGGAGGGGGGTAGGTVGAASLYGGAGGGGGGEGSTTEKGGNGGASVYGGAGGGGGTGHNDTSARSSGGTSIFAGAGGYGGSDDEDGEAGTAPAGGGGGAGRDATGSNTGGAGGDGQVIVITHF